MPDQSELIAPHTPSSRRRQYSDEQVLEGIVSGHAWAADELYETTYAVVVSTLRRVLRERSPEQEDLVQTTYERLVRSLQERRFAGACSLTTWASAIAARVAMDSLRKRVKERKVFWRQPATAEDDLAEFPGPHPLEKNLEQRSEVSRLQAALARMKPDQAKAVVLHDVLGHELSEIAKMTGVTVAAAQSRLVRGRKDLVRRMNARFGRKS